jgi:peptidoglycan hydrolase-like protein with peptidoglycan-binding domain
LSTARRKERRRLQESLNQLLNKNLDVGGQMGPDTRAALRAFQEKHGLPKTGEPTLATVTGMSKQPAAS